VGRLPALRLGLMLLPGLLPLAGCAGDAAREAEAAQAVLAAQRATLGALGQALPPGGELGAPGAEGGAAERNGSQPTTAELAAAGRGAGPTAVRELLGAAPDAVTARLGAPRLRRREGEAEVWLYSAGGCQLDLMFYATPQGMRVMHAQARAGGFGQRTESACLRDIAAQSRRAASPAPGS